MAPTAPRPAKPSKSIFDPFNSSATGHQRAENRLSGSTSWRESRTLKLNEQFGGGNGGGGKRLYDTVGAGSLDFGRDGRTENGGWEKGAPGLRPAGQSSIQESIGAISAQEESSGRPSKRVKTEGSIVQPTKVVNPFAPFRKEDGTIRATSWTSHEDLPSHQLELSQVSTAARQGVDGDDRLEAQQPTRPQIFASLVFYINGSTAPTVSDHKLKHLISDHGGRVSISLARRTVTHVIVARPAGNGGCGGGLAGSKLQKEIARVGGNALKYVTVDFVLESVGEGRRLAESRFSAMSLAAKNGSIAKAFGTTDRRKES